MEEAIDATEDTVAEVAETVEEAAEETIEETEETIEEISEEATELTEDFTEIAEEVDTGTVSVAGIAGLFTKLKSKFQKNPDSADKANEKADEFLGFMGLGEETNELEETVEDQMGEFTETVSDTVEEITEAASDAAEEVAETAEESIEEFSETIDEAAEEFTEDFSEIAEEMDSGTISVAGSAELFDKLKSEFQDQDTNKADEFLDLMGLGTETAEEAAEEITETVDEATEEFTETVDEATEEFTEAFDEAAEVAEDTPKEGFFKRIASKINAFDLSTKIGLTLSSDEGPEGLPEVVEKKIDELKADIDGQETEIRHMVDQAEENAEDYMDELKKKI